MCKVEGLWSFIRKCFISDLVGGFTHRLSLVMWKMQPPETDPIPKSICCSERKALISLLCCLPIPAHNGDFSVETEFCLWLSAKHSLPKSYSAW